MDEIFVFGSNVQGIHGAGAAKYAREKYGARMGVGLGMAGKSYAIPTRRVEHWGGKEVWYNLSLGTVRDHVDSFLSFAARSSDLRFRLTAIGCGYAGFTAEQIAPLVARAPENVRLPPEFREVLKDLPQERFWSYEEVQ